MCLCVCLCVCVCEWQGNRVKKRQQREREWERATKCLRDYKKEREKDLWTKEGLSDRIRRIYVYSEGAWLTSPSDCRRSGPPGWVRMPPVPGRRPEPPAPSPSATWRTPSLSKLHLRQKTHPHRVRTSNTHTHTHTPTQLTMLCGKPSMRDARRQPYSSHMRLPFKKSV